MLLDATVECLIAGGYTGTTGLAIAKRAGLSRGAQLHHFGTRDQLVVAAVEHLAQRRLSAVRAHLDSLTDSVPGSTFDRIDKALDLLAQALSGPLYAASLELWVAARANHELRAHLVPAELRVRAALEQVCSDYITSNVTMIRLTLDMLLGHGVMHLHDPSGSDRDETREAWKRILAEHLAHEGSAPS